MTTHEKIIQTERNHIRVRAGIQDAVVLIVSVITLFIFNNIFHA